MSVTGRAVIDFGAYPGTGHTKITLTGIPVSSVRADSEVRVWVFGGEETPDHTADEHCVETIGVSVGTIVPGVSIDIHGFNTDRAYPTQGPDVGKATPFYGKFSVGFAID